jgi:hypothetical protein
MATIGKIEWFSGEDVNPAITFRTERVSRVGDEPLLLLAFEPPALFLELDEPAPIFVIRKTAGSEDFYTNVIESQEHANSLFNLINAGVLS